MMTRSPAEAATSVGDRGADPEPPSSAACGWTIVFRAVRLVTTLRFAPRRKSENGAAETVDLAGIAAYRDAKHSR